MRTWRWPALVLIPALLVAALVVERQLDDDEPAGLEQGGAADVALPTAPAPGALSSTWYCAGGTATATAEGLAEHVVHVANPSDEAVRGQITAYPSEGEPVVQPVEVGPASRAAVRVSDLVAAPYASALVEIGGGEVAVEHELTGPTGRTVGACASAPSDTWYFPAGTTRAGTRMVLAVFNPFPADAVVDITFDTDDGTRTPQAYQALVVPGGRVLPLEVSDVVTLRDDVATEVVSRSGRVVVDQILSSAGPEEGAEEGTEEGTPEEAPEGAEGEAPEATAEVPSEPLPRGLSVVLGAPVAARTWLFPDGVGADGYGESVALFNPTEETAEVDVQVVLDEPEVNGIAEPFEVSVGPRSYSAVDVLADGRVPVGVAHAIVVRVRNDIPVVASRTILGSAASVQAGLASTIGSPVVSGRWVVPVASVGGASGSALIVFNPSSTATVRFGIEAVGDGRTGTPEGFADLELAPGGRQIVDVGVDALGFGALALVLQSDQPVVAEMRFGFAEGDDINYLMAVPVAGTISEPRGTVGELSTDAVVLEGG